MSRFENGFKLFIVDDASAPRFMVDFDADACQPCQNFDADAQINLFSKPFPPLKKCLSSIIGIESFELFCASHSSRYDSFKTCAPLANAARNFKLRVPRAPKMTCVIDSSQSRPEQEYGILSFFKTAVRFLSSSVLKPESAMQTTFDCLFVVPLVTRAFFDGCVQHRLLRLVRFPLPSLMVVIVT